MNVDRISVNLGENQCTKSAYHKKDGMQNCFCLNDTKPLLSQKYYFLNLTNEHIHVLESAANVGALTEQYLI